MCIYDMCAYMPDQFIYYLFMSLPLRRPIWAGYCEADNGLSTEQHAALQNAAVCSIDAETHAMTCCDQSSHVTVDGAGAARCAPPPSNSHAKYSKSEVAIGTTACISWAAAAVALWLYVWHKGNQHQGGSGNAAGTGAYGDAYGVHDSGGDTSKYRGDCDYADANATMHGDVMTLQMTNRCLARYMCKNHPQQTTPRKSLAPTVQSQQACR